MIKMEFQGKDMVDVINKILSFLTLVKGIGMNDGRIGGEEDGEEGQTAD